MMEQTKTILNKPEGRSIVILLYEAKISMNRISFDWIVLYKETYSYKQKRTVSLQHPETKKSIILKLSIYGLSEPHAMRLFQDTINLLSVTEKEVSSLHEFEWADKHLYDASIRLFEGCIIIGKDFDNLQTQKKRIGERLKPYKYYMAEMFENYYILENPRCRKKRISLFFKMPKGYAT